MAIKKSSKLFSVTVVPDGFVFKYVGKPEEREQLLMSPGFDAGNYEKSMHTIKRTRVTNGNLYDWCLDGWYNWGFHGNTCVGESSRAFKSALLDIIREKFGTDYESVKLPSTLDGAVCA